MKMYFIEIKSKPAYSYPNIIVEWFLFCKNKYLIGLKEFIEKRNPPNPDEIFDFLRYRSNWLAKTGHYHREPSRHPIKNGSYRIHNSW